MQIERLQPEVRTAAGRCAAADKARDSAEKAAADASAELVALRLEFQSLQAAQSKALAEAEDFDQRVAAAVAGLMAWPTCILPLLLSQIPHACMKCAGALPLDAACVGGPALPEQ